MREPSDKAGDSRTTRFMKEASEVCLKTIAWTLMAAAIGYVAAKTNSTLLYVSRYTVLGLVFVYFATHVYVASMTVFWSPRISKMTENINTPIRMLISGITCALYIGFIVISDKVVDAFIAAQ